MPEAPERSPRPRAMTSFSERLLRWFDACRRDLPWRRVRTPYSVVVSELMLQQTTVATAIPYFERFLARFPDWQALAAASLDDVLAAWAGLGYYRRARSLHALAREVAATGGEFPRTAEAALALPGVGPYTAGAVLSLAHGVPAPAVDGNVARVLSRHRGMPWDVTRARDRRAVEIVVMELQPATQPGAFNEALMELGATTCTPRSPLCGACPVAGDCRARLDGRIGELPPRKERPATREVAAAAAVIERDERFLFVRRGENEALMPGLWELPGGFVEGAGARAWLLDNILPRLGGGDVLEELGAVRHVITNRRITVTLWSCRLSRAPRARAGLAWASASDASALGLTAAATKALALLAKR